MPLTPISSLQCVDVLWRLGFRIEDANDVRVRLARDGRRVIVARHKMIEPVELRVILLTAGVEDAAFLEVLQRRSKSGEFTEPAISTGLQPRGSRTQSRSGHAGDH